MRSLIVTAGLSACLLVGALGISCSRPAAVKSTALPSHASFSGEAEAPLSEASVIGRAPARELPEVPAQPTATITASDSDALVNVRALPSTDANPIGQGTVGDRVRLGRSDTAADGHRWHYVTFAEATTAGWIRADFLDVPSTALDPTEAIPVSTGSASQPDMLKQSLDEHCGGPKAIRAYFVTPQQTIYLCEARWKLRYLSQEEGTSQVVVVDTVQERGGGYVIHNGHYEYRLDASGFEVVRFDGQGKPHPVLTEPVVHSERY